MTTPTETPEEQGGPLRRDLAPSPSDLGSVITSPRVRSWVYGAYVLVLVTLGALSAGYAVLDGPIPTWLLVANAVGTYLGIPIGGLAVANTRSSR